MADDRHIKTDIPAFLSHALPESRRREVESHVADCERCKHVLEKAKAKQSRQRRQALKSAQPGSTNLFLNRLSKQGNVERKSSGMVWLWLILFAGVGAGAYWLSHHENRWLHSFPPMPAVPTIDSSSTTVAAVPVPVASPLVSTPIPAVVAPSVRVAEVRASSPVAATTEEPEPPETPRFWSGTDSGVKDERQVVVKGRSAWRALWTEMGHTDPAPRINFNSMLVVAIFAGEKPSMGYAVQIKNPQEEEDSILVAYSVDVPPPAGSVPPALSHPYAIRTMPRGEKPVRFLEEDK